MLEAMPRFPNTKAPAFGLKRENTGVVSANFTTAVFHGGTVVPIDRAPDN